MILKLCISEELTPETVHCFYENCTVPIHECAASMNYKYMEWIDMLIYTSLRDIDGLTKAVLTSQVCSLLLTSESKWALLNYCHRGGEMPDACWIYISKVHVRYSSNKI